MRKILERFKNLDNKEVKNMKKLIMIAAVLAIAFAFLPKAEAGETAELGLSVGFALEPLKLWTDPEGPFKVGVGHEFRFKLIAEDKDAARVMFKEPHLPAWIVIGSANDQKNRIELELICNPKLGDVQDEPYHLAFTAKNDTGEEATITVDITVLRPPEPLKLWTEPEGPFTVKELETLVFKVIVEDLDSVNVYLKAESLPEGAEFNLDYPQPTTINHREGTFKWTPKIGQEGDSNDPNYPKPYVAVFKATNEKGEEVKLDVRIDVMPAPVISIEITPDHVDLSKVKLGQVMSVQPSPEIKNVGNVRVMVDIGYAPISGLIRPGMKQGPDTFITVISNFIEQHEILPPDERLKLGDIRPDGGLTLLMSYGAPTAVSKGINGHDVTYEFRAYAAIK